MFRTACIIMIMAPSLAWGVKPSATTEESFTFISEHRRSLTRTLADYEIQNKALYEAVSKKRVLVFGGTHLTAREAFDLSKQYALEVRLDLMVNAGVPEHTGHTVINTDPATKPDYQEDFTTPNLIQRLGLLGKFEYAIFENVRPSLSWEEASVRNAWDALQPQGTLIVYPITPMLLEATLATVGFQHIKVQSSGYKDIFSDRCIGFPVCTATKPQP